MLLNFKIKNFKSFKDEMELKMTPAQKIHDLEYSILRDKTKKQENKALSTSVIYGPNSAGKTNIIGGMEVLRSIILRGNIKNSITSTTPNLAADKLELIPNIDSKEEPVAFYIKFTEKEMLFEIKLEIKLGNFLEKDYQRKIIEEELKINNHLIYAREEKLIVGEINEIQDLLIENFSKQVAEKIAQTNLDDEELFFNGMFKNLYSKKIFDIIYEWFQNKFKIIYHADKLEISPIISAKEGKKYYINKELDEALKSFGLTSEHIAYPIKEKEEEIIPLSLIKIEGKKEGRILPAECFESFGTIRFLNIFPIIMDTIIHGKVAVIDELDASIHPMAIMSIINIFHNNEINTKGAQLIFNTHNPIFLNNALLRRDEIKFVEKEDSSSVLYALSDFGTTGKNGVRNTENYMKNYFINKYGAIKNIDFSDVFLEKDEEVPNEKKEM